MAITLLNPKDNSWSAEVHRLRTLLGAPDNPHLFPPHFLEATFPRIGGQIAVVEAGRRIVGVGFLFPRTLRAGAREFTLRFHQAHEHFEIGQTQLTTKLEELLGNGRVVFYAPQSEPYWEGTTHQIGDLDIGRPDSEEALAVRALQQQIWGSDPDSLYPADLCSSDFRAGTALVARLDRRPVGFLLGFYKFDGSQLPETWSQRYLVAYRLESQVLGILREYRGRGIGTALKKVQAENARREGIDIVNWTVDPLQYGNAILNFGRLRAIACDFYPNYYTFRNVLNQAPASRFGITWLVSSERVGRALSRVSRATILDLRGNSTIRRVNAGWAELHLEEDAQSIAIEIPASWTGLQKERLEEALVWRHATDRLFQRYIGWKEGDYMVTGVGEDGDRKYLIAERVDSALLESLAG
ncbi:MAG: GNAT family N-acetyltransferase [Anaerolineae bacterium]